MLPGDIKFATHAFRAPNNWNEEQHGECITLQARRRSDGTMQSAWFPSAEELALLNAGEPVILTVWGGQPPVSLNVNAGEK